MKTPNSDKPIATSYSTNRVATSGVFDLYHAGHASLLKFAKSFGSHLIVLLNSDESAIRLGKQVVNSQELRKLVLESVRWVDQVIIFDKDTPCVELAEIKPDFYIKGSDYDHVNKSLAIPEADVVEFYDGIVVGAPVLKWADGDSESCAGSDGADDDSDIYRLKED